MSVVVFEVADGFGQDGVLTGKVARVGIVPKVYLVGATVVSEGDVFVTDNAVVGNSVSSVLVVDGSVEVHHRS